MKGTLPPERLGPMTDRLRAALALVRQAADLAGQRRRDVWQYAVEIAVLRDAGLNPSELRWLVDGSYLAHAVETTTPRAAARSFVRARNLGFAERTCFVLATEGAALAGAADDPRPDDRRPHWDAAAHELRWGRLLVKRFRVPAPNQERILTGFEEEGWPPHIDDPLPAHAGYDAKQRLHETIKSLNRHHACRAIVFCGDGAGKGVCWRPAGR